MREKNEAPRPDLRGASTKKGGPGDNQDRSRSFQDTCLGPGCGACYITAIGDRSWCEIETIGALKRELAAAIAGESETRGCRGGGNDE